MKLTSRGNIARVSDVLQLLRRDLSEHLSADVLEGYRRQDLPPAVLLRADDHLGMCEDCRARAAQVDQPDQALRAFEANLRAAGRSVVQEHLPYERLEAFVDGTLVPAEREITEGHVDLCRLCAEEVEDLRVIRASLATRSTETRQNRTGAAGFAGWFAAGRPLFSTPTPLRLAAALALLLVSLTLLLLWQQTRPSPEVARGPVTGATENTPPPSPVTSPFSPPAAGAPTQIVVALDDVGGRVTLDAEGKIEGLEYLSPSAQRVVGDALAHGRVDTPDHLSGLRGKAGTLMGSGVEGVPFSLTSPVGKVIRSDRPGLRWRPLPGASVYTVTVLDSDLKVVAASPQLSTTEWKPPRALKRGRVYKWQVSALKDGQETLSPVPPAPEARFLIVEKAKDDELRRAEQAAVRSRLALGVLYARAGLLDEAERELRELVAANPQSTVARNLLRNVRAKRN